MTQRLESLHNWLNAIFKTDHYTFSPASEDASFRRYYRVKHDEVSYIVMDAPPEHENCAPFVDITHRLKHSKINVPVIENQDIQKGFLLLTDLGDELYLPNLNNASAPSLYADAIKTLVNMQVYADVTDLPCYDEALLYGEMDLFSDWLLDRHLNISLTSAEQADLAEVMTLLVDNALQQPQCFVHRDYHSRNLMLTRQNNPGVIDYQDAVYGPVSYDLVSLFKDAYISWPQGHRDEWVKDYIRIFNQTKNAEALKFKQFRRWFDLMGVQRHLKIGGIFARLWRRDGKPGYLADIPRTLNYIQALKPVYPELDALCQLIQSSVLPGLATLGGVCEQ